MSVKRPAKRFTVLIEDGADELHFLCVRGHDQDGAIRQAVKRFKRDMSYTFNDTTDGEKLAIHRALKRLRMKRVFAGHVREIGRGDVNVTNL